MWSNNNKFFLSIFNLNLAATGGRAKSTFLVVSLSSNVALPLLTLDFAKYAGTESKTGLSYTNK